jgi:uroporphyrinogen-III decarboxylase
LDERYLQGHANLADAQAALARENERFCVFGKTGGPYLRSSFVRGEAQFLMDIAADPPLAKAIADKVADHLLRVGLEEIRRWGLQDTGMWIFDDMAYNSGPVFSPKSFERIFLPSYRRMIQAYKQAGARYVFFHSDGNILPLLDMLVDAGIDGINPLERRAGMDPVELRRKYPRLILAGGVDNTDTLINGPASRIESEVRNLIELGRDGGLIIGTHSISPEVPLDHFMAYHHACQTYGDFR